MAAEEAADRSACGRPGAFLFGFAVIFTMSLFVEAARWLWIGMTCFRCSI